MESEPPRTGVEPIRFDAEPFGFETGASRFDLEPCRFDFELLRLGSGINPCRPVAGNTAWVVGAVPGLLARGDELVGRKLDRHAFVCQGKR